MPTKILRHPDDIEKLARLLTEAMAQGKQTITVSWAKGDNRSGRQNRLAQRWFTDIATQLGDTTHEEIRATCKLIHGVPILRAENEAFRASYDRTMKHLPYEAKVQAIKAFDMPVTRLMSVKQMTAFMDEMQRHWSGVGIRLTDPEALRYEEEFA